MIAYVVSAYRLPEQLGTLLHALARTPGARTWVHVDARTDAPTFAAMQAAAPEGVTWLERHPSPWGGLGHVRASLKGIDAALAAGADVAALLTGQDYPIASDETIASTLTGGGSWMEWEALPRAQAWPAEDGGLARVEKRWRDGRPVSWDPRRRRLPAGLQPYGGSGYWVLQRECLEHVMRVLADQPEVLRFFAGVRFPDEIFFQTLLCSSPLRDAIEPRDQHYIRFVAGSANPDVLGPGDLPALGAASELWARKFDESRDPGILARVENEVRG